MKTIYLVKSPSDNINFECTADCGLHFIESAVDIKFLNNIIFDQRMKLFIDQRKGRNWVEKAIIWFILLADSPLNNENLENELFYIRSIGNQLFKVTKLGQVFSYKNVYSIPNVSESWRLEDIFIELDENGEFKEVRCIDRSKPLEQSGDSIKYHAKAKTIKSDLVCCLGSDEQNTQCQFMHITIPSTDILLNGSGLRIDGSLEAINSFHNPSHDNSPQRMIFELYNNAITAESIFVSFLLLFQIIELIIDSAKSTKIDKKVIDQIANLVCEAKLIDSIFIDRFTGSLRGLKKETSKELLEFGLIDLVGEEAKAKLNFSEFSSWRKMRGSITHPKSTQCLTDSQFVEQYKNLRVFVDEFVAVLPNKSS